MKQADIDEGGRPGARAAESAVMALKKRNRVLEGEVENAAASKLLPRGSSDEEQSIARVEPADEAKFWSM